MIPQGWRTLTFNWALLAVAIIGVAFLGHTLPKAFWEAISALACLGNTILRMHTTTPVCTKPVAVNQSETTITNAPTTIAGIAGSADTSSV